MRDRLRWGWMSCPAGRQQTNRYSDNRYSPMPKFLGRFSRRGFLAFLPEDPALDCYLHVSFFFIFLQISWLRLTGKGAGAAFLDLGGILLLWRLSLREKPLANAHSLESFCCSKSEGTLLPPYALAISLSPCSAREDMRCIWGRIAGRLGFALTDYLC